MKKYGRILLVGCVSLAMNAAACSEKAAPVDGVICALEKYFTRNSSCDSQIVDKLLDQLDLSVVENLTRYIAPLHWNIGSGKRTPAEDACILISSRMLIHFSRLFQKDFSNISDYDKAILKLNFEKWEKSFVKNTDFMKNIVDSYNENATDVIGRSNGPTKWAP